MVARRNTVTTRRVTRVEDVTHVVRLSMRWEDIKAIEQRDSNVRFCPEVDDKPICVVYLYTGENFYVLEKETELVRQWEKFLKLNNHSLPAAANQEKLFSDVSESKGSQGENQA